jgi:hypothetical protein
MTTPGAAASDLPTRLREDKRLCDEATEGPWTPCLGSGNIQCTALMRVDESSEIDLVGQVTTVCDCLPDWTLENNSAPKDHLPNLNFIARARTALPEYRELLRRYGGHEESCRAVVMPDETGLDNECDCGWSAVEEALRDG